MNKPPLFVPNELERGTSLLSYL